MPGVLSKFVNYCKVTVVNVHFPSYFPFLHCSTLGTSVTLILDPLPINMHYKTAVNFMLYSQLKIFILGFFFVLKKS